GGRWRGARRPAPSRATPHARQRWRVPQPGPSRVGWPPPRLRRGGVKEHGAGPGCSRASLLWGEVDFIEVEDGAEGRAGGGSALGARLVAGGLGADAPALPDDDIAHPAPHHVVPRVGGARL